VSLATVRERLLDLEAKGQLEKRLAARDETLPWSDLLSLLQYPAILGVAIHVVFLANAGGLPARAEFLWLVALAAVALALRYGSGLARTPAQRLRLRLREHGALAAGAIVQANDAWFADANDRWLPGNVLVCFDANAWREPARLVAAAQRLFALRAADRRSLPPEHAALAWKLYHEIGPTASWSVPSDLCGGLKDCWLVSAMLPPEPLRDGELLVVLALPGETSPEAVALLPADIAAPAAAP
jgi:hypothetical protein